MVNSYVPSMMKSSKIDRSKVPVLKEDDIGEQFVKGSGPGGSNVNKLVNCVVLSHKPTGITVKCHESRLQHQNRALARKMLIEKLDEHYNGEMSVKGQKEALKKKRKLKMEQKNRRQREKRKRENDDDSDSDSEDDNTYVSAYEKNIQYMLENKDT